MCKKLKKLFNDIKIGVKTNVQKNGNKKNKAKNKSIAGDNNTGNQIADTINNFQPQVMQVPMISEQARTWFNKHMKAYGCPGDTFAEQCVLSQKFLEEVAVARNEFIKWAQDNTEDGINLPPYKECYAKAKELWNEYVKSSPKEIENAID